MSLKLKIHMIALGLALSAILPAAAKAQGTAAPSAAVQGKIGIIAIQEAIANTNEGKKEMDALQQRFGPKSSELKASNDELEKLKAQLQAQGDKLSDQERENRVKTITDKQKTLQRNYEDFQTEVQQSEQEVINRLGQKMLTVLEKYAAANGYIMVLDVSNPQTPVLYASQATNITKQVIDAYNAENPATAGAKPASAPAAAKPSAPAPRPATTPKKP